MTVKRYYVDAPYGQIHYKVWGDIKDDKPLLLCLPPSPFSGVAYNTIAPFLASKYNVVALDYPGFGNSDTPTVEATIQIFAEAAITVTMQLRANKDIDVLGFHTGCLVAMEAACKKPKVFRQLILVDVPFFSVETQTELLSKKYGEISLSPDLSCLQPVWESCVINRKETLGMARAYELFVDQCRLGERGGVAFQAAFTYDCWGQASKVNAPTTIIATKAGLYEESLEAHRQIPGAELVEVHDVTISVLEQSALKIANIIMNDG